MNKVDIKTIIEILCNRNYKFLQETKYLDKNLVKVIKLYCLLNKEDFKYLCDYYKSIKRYNKIIEKENKIRKILKMKKKTYMSDWVEGDFLGG